MKWETKSNQFIIRKSETHKVKVIRAIKVDVLRKTVEYIQVEDCIDYIQKNNNFFKYEILKISENMDCLFVGIDEDLKGKNSFKIKGFNENFYSNAILVKYPKSGNLYKLQNTKLTIEYINSLIIFN